MISGETFISLDNLPANVEIVLLDPKGGDQFWSGEFRSVVATVSALRYNIEAPSVEFTTLILTPSMVNRVNKTYGDLHGRKLTIAEAKSLGFASAKLTP